MQIDHQHGGKDGKGQGGRTNRPPYTGNRPQTPSSLNVEAKTNMQPGGVQGERPAVQQVGRTHNHLPQLWGARAYQRNCPRARGGNSNTPSNTNCVEVLSPETLPTLSLVG
jgi:hypothetical protein